MFGKEYTMYHQRIFDFVYYANMFQYNDVMQWPPYQFDMYEAMYINKISKKVELPS